jgi:uncharacterized protein (TIGR00661 family)
MARILYGLCGEGLGHASRSKILINHLKKKGHNVRIVAGGKAFVFLSKEFKHVERVESPRFEYKGNQVRLLYSCLKMLYATIAKTPKSLKKVKKIIKEFKPDIIITDSEPISHVAARLHKIKRLSVDNPQALLHRKYKVLSGEIVPWLILFIALKVSMFGADKYLIYDFSDKQINNSRVLFLKPLIQEGIQKQQPKIGEHIFVYQTSISTGFICKILKQFNERFIVYGFNKDQVDGNIIFKTFNDDEFYTDISNCKAVITNGGFTVISEALYLKKPVFSLPIRHQFEQVLNGQFVQNLGFGEYHLEFGEEKLRKFLAKLDEYRDNLQSYNPGEQNGTLNTIEREMYKLL